ncbi:MAG: xanthine dehydrogenase family protein molybdopterin-binding subunit [Anaerolineaceae bacterium]
MGANPERRKDAYEKVTGAARYTTDIAADAWWAVAVRAPYHHARILEIDPARALTLPGVKRVITAADIPGNRCTGDLMPDQPVLAWEEVRHWGEPVALVIAVDRDAACRAAEQVSVRYEPLPAVFDPVEALKPDAPLVHPNGNLLSHYVIHEGDAEDALSQSDVVLEETFSVQRISPAYLETENSLALWQEEDTLLIWASTQKPYADRDAVADVLGLPVDRVQVCLGVVGGGFGGKEDPTLPVLTGLAAWCTKHNVRMVNTRSESFWAHPKRHPAQMRYRVGARKDGTLTAVHATIWMDTGAYASLGPAVGGLLTEVSAGPYRVPNAHLETYVVYTHSPKSGAVRGFGTPQVHFAMESIMDMLAQRLKLDPLEVRRRNLIRPGDALPSRVVMNNSAEALPECLRRAEQAEQCLRSIPAGAGKRSGVGMALAMQSMGYGAKIPDDSTNRLEWLPDGRVRVCLGASDLGQGLAAASESLVARALDLPDDAVVAALPDTHVGADGGATCASRMTYLVGNSLLLASDGLKTQLMAQASLVLHLPPEQLSYRRGQVILPDGRAVSAAEIASRAADEGEPLAAQATFSFPYPEETTPQHLPPGLAHMLYCFGAQVIRVEVDEETGQVAVTDVVAVHDVGKAIHPTGVQGQIEGGTAMGIGYALYEDMPLKENGEWVDTFAEYLLPTAADMPPQIEETILEIPEASGPYGAKGVGEIVTVPQAPAIANAVFDAVGVRVHSLPIRPETVLNAMNDLSE